MVKGGVLVAVRKGNRSGAKPPDDARFTEGLLVDVRRSFGQPVFVGSGARVADVAGMLKAGEDAATVAEEFGVSTEDVRTAARILLGRAA